MLCVMSLQVRNSYIFTIFRDLFGYYKYVLFSLQLKAGADPEAASKDVGDLLSPPIVLASQRNNPTIVKELLAKKVNVNALDTNKKNAVHYAAANSAGMK